MTRQDRVSEFTPTPYNNLLYNSPDPVGVFIYFLDIISIEYLKDKTFGLNQRSAHRPINSIVIL